MAFFPLLDALMHNMVVLWQESYCYRLGIYLFDVHVWLGMCGGLGVLNWQSVERNLSWLSQNIAQICLVSKCQANGFAGRVGDLRVSFNPVQFQIHSVLRLIKSWTTNHQLRTSRNKIILKSRLSSTPKKRNVSKHLHHPKTDML